MSIRSEILRFSSDSQPFIQLVHKEMRAAEQKFGIRVSLKDANARDVVKKWAISLYDIRFEEPDVKLLVDHLIGDLLRRMLDADMLAANPQELAEVSPDKDRHFVAAYPREYVAVQVAVAMLKSCLGKAITRPAPDIVIDTAIVISINRGRCYKLTRLLGLSDTIDIINRAAE